MEPLIFAGTFFPNQVLACFNDKLEVTKLEIIIDITFTLFHPVNSPIFLPCPILLNLELWEIPMNSPKINPGCI